MKARLRNVTDHDVAYTALMFVCPGCVAGGPEGYEGLHMLPVNSPQIDKPYWDWDGDLERPTLHPSILTHPILDKETGEERYSRCHSYLKRGVFEFLTDSSHPLAGQNIPIPDLPEWAEELS